MLYIARYVLLPCQFPSVEEREGLTLGVYGIEVRVDSPRVYSNRLFAVHPRVVSWPPGCYNTHNMSCETALSVSIIQFTVYLNVLITD